jgi:hypothetical protein
MQLRLHALALAALALVGGAAPAHAGIVCTVLLSTGGLLGLSGDGARLGSEENGGGSAVISILSVGTNTLTIAAPTLTQSPGGFNPVNLAFEVAYRGTDVLAGIDQPYTTAQTSVPLPNMANAVLLTLDNRVTTTAGFAAGNYQTRTVVTCS